MSKLNGHIETWKKERIQAIQEQGRSPAVVRSSLSAGRSRASTSGKENGNGNRERSARGAKPSKACDRGEGEVADGALSDRERRRLDTFAKQLVELVEVCCCVRVRVCVCVCLRSSCHVCACVPAIVAFLLSQGAFACS